MARWGGDVSGGKEVVLLLGTMGGWAGWGKGSKDVERGWEGGVGGREGEKGQDKRCCLEGGGR